MTFEFTEEQKLDILKASYYISEASKHLVNHNGMLASILNAMSMDLISQAGYLDEVSAPKANLSDAEKAEIDSMISDISKELSK